MIVSVSARGFSRMAISEATVLTDSDLKAANTKAAPYRVKPARLAGIVVGAETVRMELPPASLSVVNLSAGL
jgi:alpha-N-arabinofuranosidase